MKFSWFQSIVPCFHPPATVHRPIVAAAATSQPSPWSCKGHGTSFFLFFGQPPWPHPLLKEKACCFLLLLASRPPWPLCCSSPTARRFSCSSSIYPVRLCRVYSRVYTYMLSRFDQTFVPKRASRNNVSRIRTTHEHMALFSKCFFCVQVSVRI